MAAEQLLQLFTPRRIEPSRVQFIATPTTRALVQQHSPSSALPGLTLAPWLESIQRATMTGEVHSTAHPITPEAQANALGQKYAGPVAVPANCGLRVAIRRTLRVGKNAGVPLEDLGISLGSERRYRMTRNDVLGSNADLMEFAGKQLKARR